MKLKAKNRKLWVKFILVALSILIVAFSGIALIVYLYQDELVQSEINDLNKDFSGQIVIGNTSFEPFTNFPSISIKINNVKVLESKKDTSAEILKVDDIYLGFNPWDVLDGNFKVQNLLIEDGFFNLILHKDGSTNLQNALKSNTEDDEKPINFHLKNIELRNLDIHKLDEATNVDVETFIYSANGGFKTSDSLINIHLDSEFELNVIDNGDSTYIKHKHFEVHSDIELNEKKGILTVRPSDIKMEHGDFNIEGLIDLKNDMAVDLTIKGTKPNFDMLIAFAPQDVIPVLERYKNAGKIYFNASVKGPTLHGVMPTIKANFGASEAFLENTRVGKRIDNMGFKGYFTNGIKRDLESMEFSLKDMTANLEKGSFLGAITVKNFKEPEIDMKLNADFNLDFLTQFLGLNDVNVSGKTHLEMRFHDIINIDQPEQALKDLNQAYFSELSIQDFSLESSDLPVKIDSLDAHLIMNGKKAELKFLDMKFGKSDLSIKGYLSNLPAIVHHTNIPVVAHLDIDSKVLDISEVSRFSETDSTGIDERVENLKLGFSFKSSAKAFTESKHLPEGEFFIDNLYAQLKHYPHELHDFNADILIGNRDLKIQDLTGYIDNSDFHFNGLIHDYAFWLKDTLNGDVELDINLNSNVLKLENLLSYKGENYIPKEYRHEEFDNLKLHFNSKLHYKNGSFHSFDIDLDKLDSKMHIHPMRLKNFEGNFHYEDEHLMVKNFEGKIGRTAFDIDMNYYLGENPEIRKRDNHFGLKANYIDFDQLFNFSLNSKPEKTTQVNSTKSKQIPDSIKHAESFNIYELPFTNMTFDINVGHFIYNRIDLQKIKTKFRTNSNHYIYMDTLNLNAAGGSIAMSGYFNGSNPKQIYLKPNLNFTNINLDKLLFKFENFGQDAIVSDNLHGKLTSNIKGNIRIFPDLVPNLDQSEIHMDVMVLDGRLENYSYMLFLSDYMGDKNLKSIRFDTLQNHIDIKNGIITIPKMTIESTLGHYELSGKQDMDFNMEYYFSVPWSVVKEAARYKLFGSKKPDDIEPKNDIIIEKNSTKKTRFINIKIIGNKNDYKISLGKNKQ